jgi:hypothetical protein
MSQDDPVRWLDQPSQLSAELARAMSMYAEHGPGSAAHAAQRAALLAKVGPPNTALTPTRRAWNRAGAGLGTLVLATTSWWWLRDTPSVDTEASIRSRSPVAIDAAQVAPAEAALSPPPPAASTFSVSSEDGNVAPRARIAGAVHPRPTVQHGELALLARARRLLPSAPEETLRITELHRRRFAAPSFAQERELLAIEALVRRGEYVAAAQRARRFEKSYPHSLHRERLRILLASP